MAILAGIDEAGFGPLLGPLVVSASVLSMDPDLMDADLWQVLRRSVGKTRRHLGGRLLITDSKKAYDRAAGLGHLERTVLAVLRAMGKTPADLTELLSLLCPECLGRLSEYPWYQKVDSRVPSGDPADIRIAAQVLGDDMNAQGARLIDMRSCCLDVGLYNAMVGRVKNKSHVLFIVATGLIQRILDAHPDEDVHIQIDRHGGRVHYRDGLMRSFADMDLHILREDKSASVYEWRRGSHRVRLTFRVGADGLYLPVALASMVSKYLRELLMECVNRYFLGLDAGLQPTAGYWQDGLRFVDELRTRLPHVEIDRHRLIRCR